MFFRRYLRKFDICAECRYSLRKRLTPLWVEYSHHTRKHLWENDDLMFEMYSFSLASAHLAMNTTVSEDWMLSSVSSPREGWDELHTPHDHHAPRIEGPVTNVMFLTTLIKISKRKIR